jgi:glycosyltransferase involved in cell wall biosynthesis
MRVAHVITRLIVGGAQENTIASVFGLQQKPGVQVNLISGPTSGPEGSLEPLFAQNPQRLTIVPTLVRPIHPLKDLIAWRQLATLFREQAPQIVHTHSGKAGILARLAASRAGVPVIIHTIHGPSFGAFQGWPANICFRTAESAAARVTTHFVVVADAMKAQYLSAGIGRPEQYTRIYSGFNLEPFRSSTNDLALRARLGIAPEDIVVGKIARLFRLKGHDDLFAIAPPLIQDCPRLKFLLIGDGPWRHRFEEKARSLGLTRHFIFAGLVPPDEVPRLVGIMDLLVHLSLREGLARALPQALAAGKPVVAYDCDGAREVCFPEETGFLVNPGDLTVLQQKLLLLARQPDLRRRLGETGRRFVQANFAIEKMVNDLYQLYLRLVPLTAAESQL